MLQVYTGDGKGKTTAALGLGVRAIGHGKKVVMLQFLKDDPEYGEFKARELLKNFTIHQVGRNEFVNFRNPEQIDLQLAQAGWTQAVELMVSKACDILILDEFTLVLKYGLIDTAQVYACLNKYRATMEIVITGRYAPQELMDIADLVTNMGNTKHYFDAGVPSRTGIDH